MGRNFGAISSEVDVYSILLDDLLVGTLNDSNCVENTCHFNIGPLTVGEHTFAVNAVDSAGNASLFAAVVAEVILPGDVNQDGRIDASDLMEVANTWGTTNQPTDIDQDGIVGLLDLALVARRFGEGIQEEVG